MKAFLNGPKRKASPSPPTEDTEDSTELKLAMLASLHSSIDQETLMDVLLAHDGCVADASASLQNFKPGGKKTGVIGQQQSLRHFTLGTSSTSPVKKKVKSKKGATLHLFDPADVAEHTPCTIIHNFLPPDLANDLLKELLDESHSFEQITFKLFDNVVSSPHTSSFYVGTSSEIETLKTDYYYNGSKLNVNFTTNLSRRKQSMTNTDCSAGHSPINTATRHCTTPGARCCQQGSPKSNKDSVPRRQEAQIPISKDMDPQCRFCKLL